MGGSFGVDGFAGGEDGFLAVDETVDVIDDLQIVRLAVHFGQRVEAFNDSAVGGIGFQAGRFGRAGDDGTCWLLRLVKKEMNFSFASFNRTTHLSSRPSGDGS